jgi:hypothetical protein
MKSESENTFSPETRPSPRSVSAKDLITLFEAQRLANEQLYTGLRDWFASGSDVLQNPPPREHTRRRGLYEKAFELSMQAEAKIELLLSGFRVRL